MPLPINIDELINGQTVEWEPFPLSGIGLQIISDCAVKPLSKSEIAGKLNQSANSGTLKRVLPVLIEMGVLEYTIPGKLNSPLQKYRTTAVGYAFLDE